MKLRHYILVACLMLAVAAAGVLSDTTFSWSQPQAKGVLTYTSLNLITPTINGVSGFSGVVTNDHTGVITNVLAYANGVVTNVTYNP